MRRERDEGWAGQGKAEVAVTGGRDPGEGERR